MVYCLRYVLILELSRESASHMVFMLCTAIHNCSSLGSLVFTTLRQYILRYNVPNKNTITNHY